jgi:hypothetical protein
MITETATQPKRTKRSTLAKELDALSELIKLLKPLTKDQRDKIISAAQEMLAPSELEKSMDVG